MGNIAFSKRNVYQESFHLRRLKLFISFSVISMIENYSLEESCDKVSNDLWDCKYSSSFRNILIACELHMPLRCVLKHVLLSIRLFAILGPMWRLFVESFMLRSCASERIFMGSTWHFVFIHMWQTYKRMLHHGSLFTTITCIILSRVSLWGT